MIIRLPKWCILNKFPAFHDTESLTAIEQTARLYGKVNEIIESYNKFAEEINKAIDEYESNADKEQDSFICQLSQLTHNFINTVDMKIAHQDRAIAEVYDNLKNDIKTAIDLQISEFLTEGEIENLVNNALININNVVSGFETELAEISAYNAQQDSRLNQIELNVSELQSNVNVLAEEHTVFNNNINKVETELTEYKQANDNAFEQLSELEIFKTTAENDISYLKQQSGKNGVALYVDTGLVEDVIEHTKFSDVNTGHFVDSKISDYSICKVFVKGWGNVLCDISRHYTEQADGNVILSKYTITGCGSPSTLNLTGRQILSVNMSINPETFEVTEQTSFLHKFIMVTEYDENDELTNAYNDTDSGEVQIGGIYGII